MHNRVALQRVADLTAHRLQLLIAKLSGQGHVHFHLALLLVEQFVECAGDGGEQIQAAFFVDQAKEVQHERGCAAVENAVDQLAALVAADGRIGKHLREIRVGVDHLPQFAQLLTHRRGGLGFIGQFEQRLGVRGGQRRCVIVFGHG